MAAATAPQRPVVTLVHSHACHFCDDARAVLAELATQFPLDVELIDATHPRGAALLDEHRAAMFPLVLVDGTYFSVGRLSRRKLRKLLGARLPAGVA